MGYEKIKKLPSYAQGNFWEYDWTISGNSEIKMYSTDKKQLKNNITDKSISKEKKKKENTSDTRSKINTQNCKIIR